MGTYVSKQLLPDCSIKWTDAELEAQSVQNWIRYFVDNVCLVLILVVIYKVGFRRYKELRKVYVQLILLLLAQLLYCTRSSARLYLDDRTYLGKHLPWWTYLCQQYGDIINCLQHWIYTSVYIDTALVLRLYYSIESPENDQARLKR